MSNHFYGAKSGSPPSSKKGLPYNNSLPLRHRQRHTQRQTLMRIPQTDLVGLRAEETREHDADETDISANNSDTTSSELREHTNSDTTSSENDSETRSVPSPTNPSTPSRAVSRGPCNSNKRQLNVAQLGRLCAVLNSGVIVNGLVEGAPTFAVRPIDFLDVLKRNLKLNAPMIRVDRCCLYGGAATYCMSPTSDHFFNDIDLVIHVDFDKSNIHLHMDKIKRVVIDSLREVVHHCLRNHNNSAGLLGPNELDDLTLTYAYIQKMYKHTGSVTDNNIWSLFSFRNYDGRNLEVKFVHTLDRCYLFSIDSWQIELGSNFLNRVAMYWSKHVSLNDLSTEVDCKFPNINDALEDVKKKIIRVVSPESVRGGCFLRYLDLLHKGYVPALSHEEKTEQEFLMLNRFIRDFPDKTSQLKAITTYMLAHMALNSIQFKLDFLRRLVKTIDACQNSRPYLATLKSLKSSIQSSIRDLESMLSYPKTSLQF